MVTIKSMAWVGTGWSVAADVQIDTNSRSSTYLLDLPEKATEEDIKSAILKLYR